MTPTSQEKPKGERLQKVLASAGVSSRRQCEGLIAAGRVRVNGRVVTEMGVRVDARRDKIEVDGRRIVREPMVYVLLHKPRGVMTTLNDPEGRPTVATLLAGLPARVFPVGRLDFHTSGVLFCTNDGTLAQALLHPRRHVPKTYVAKVRGDIDEEQLEPWRQGLDLAPVEGERHSVRTSPAEVHILRHAPPGTEAEGAPGTHGSTWIEVTLREGRTRQIHRMADATGLFVMRLVRTHFAGLTADKLRPGEHRFLTDDEVTRLRATWLRAQENAERRESLEGDGETVTIREPGVVSSPSRKPRAERERVADKNKKAKPKSAVKKKPARPKEKPMARPAGRGGV